MERRAVAIHGVVQGVGFRPYVYRLAREHQLAGTVLNQVDGVHIEVEGESALLDEFMEQLLRDPPPLARIDDWSFQRQPPRGDRAFRIVASDKDAHGQVVITPDAGTCDECVAEIFDPMNRRFRYAFTNCTSCGPRLTIITAAPYDRASTTMSRFEMCDDCRREYEDPSDRRFHAQPNACPKCGPRLSLLDAQGQVLDGADPLNEFVAAILAGKIGALKGIGGFHLVCEVGNEKAVAELRRRKHRDEKPFAIMVRDLKSLAEIAHVDDEEAALLASPLKPIVLLRKRGNSISGLIAPGNPLIGVMLPYTPLHHLLLHEMRGKAVVMTSGNRSDEPIAYRDEEAVEQLRGIADVFLTHNRAIHVRCDDSVTRVVDGAESPIRRSRGYAPQPLSLAIPATKPILAVGGQLKGTFALGHDRRAIVSHHLGDLDHFAAFKAFEKDIGLYEELFAIRPAVIAHDLHPDYASTRYAISRAGQDPAMHLIPIQHHHAHMASCMAEHDLCDPVIGVTFDGTGFGIDGAIWGGEFLVGDYRSFKRAAHLRYVGLPGGEAAVREPWRIATAYLADAGAQCDSFEQRVDAKSRELVRTMLARKINSPLTSSAGRLFDAVASLIGVRDRVSYEGQAAVELEWLASRAEASGEYPFETHCDGEGEPTVIDWRPVIREIIEDLSRGIAQQVIATRFHSTLVDVISTVCRDIAAKTSISDVVFSGGVFLNALLSTEAARRLERDGLCVYRHRTVPTNDGGLSLGQLAIAAKLIAN